MAQSGKAMSEGDLDRVVGTILNTRAKTLRRKERRGKELMVNREREGTEVRRESREKKWPQKGTKDAKNKKIQGEGG